VDTGGHVALFFRCVGDIIQAGGDRKMSKMFVLLLMVFCHVFDDFCLQGVLSQMKCKDWWKSDEDSKDAKAKKKPADKKADTADKEELCKYDYIAALVAHSISWAFMIMLPIAVFFSFNPPAVFYIVFAVNVIIHAIVDNMKANQEKINLITDQLIHMVQIGVTALVFLVLI